MGGLMKYLLLVLFVSISFGGTHFKDGDLIFQQSRSSQSSAIKLATKSDLTHMGIIVSVKGVQYVYEAVQPVKLTPISRWIKRGVGAKYYLKRLDEKIHKLTAQHLKSMNEVGQKYLGKNYDLWFNWSDKEIYCSELVYKIYKEALGLEIGELQQLKDFDLSHQKVKLIMKQRYGENIPYEEVVISPVSMFNSEKLVLIYAGTLGE